VAHEDEDEDGEGDHEESEGLEMDPEHERSDHSEDGEGDHEESEGELDPEAEAHEDDEGEDVDANGAVRPRKTAKFASTTGVWVVHMHARPPCGCGGGGACVCADVAFASAARTVVQMPWPPVPRQPSGPTLVGAAWCATPKQPLLPVEPLVCGAPRAHTSRCPTLCDTTIKTRSQGQAPAHADRQGPVPLCVRPRG
jgi:hypothetical protein